MIIIIIIIIIIIPCHRVDWPLTYYYSMSPCGLTFDLKFIHVTVWVDVSPTSCPISTF